MSFAKNDGNLQYGRRFFKSLTTGLIFFGKTVNIKSGSQTMQARDGYDQPYGSVTVDDFRTASIEMQARTDQTPPAKGETIQFVDDAGTPLVGDEYPLFYITNFTKQSTEGQLITYSVEALQLINAESSS